MECPFVVGQHVVCIYRPEEWVSVDGSTSPLPAKGEVCRIMKMATGPLLGVDGNEHVSETDVMLNMRGYLRWMGHTGFRPLQERPMKTDISVFAPLLKNPAPSGPLEPTPVQEPTPDKVPELEPTS